MQLPENRKESDRFRLDPKPPDGLANYNGSQKVPVVPEQNCNCNAKLVEMLKDFHQANNEMFQHLTEEIGNLRREVLSMRSSTADNYQPSILPLVPFENIDDFLKFELKIQEDQEKFNELTVKFIYPDNRVCYVTKCTVCGKEQQNIKQHMRIHLDLKPFQCPYCERAFRQRGNYTRHVNIHTGEKPYKCDQCEKAFADPASLRAHIVKHTGSRAYRCEVCGKSYGHSHVLAAHKRIHTQDRRHPCSYCVKRFLSSHALKKHIRTHTGERPYQCKLCPKSFTTSGNLATHNRVHTKVKPYACTVCDMSFAYRSVLKTHLKTHDRSGPDEEEPTTIVIETKDDDTNEENGNDELRSEIGDEIEYEIYLNVFDDPEGKDSEAGEET